MSAIQATSAIARKRWEDPVAEVRDAASILAFNTSTMCAFVKHGPWGTFKGVPKRELKRARETALLVQLLQISEECGDAQLRYFNASDECNVAALLSIEAPVTVAGESAMSYHDLPNKFFATLRDRFFPLVSSARSKVPSAPGINEIDALAPALVPHFDFKRLEQEFSKVDWLRHEKTIIAGIELESAKLRGRYAALHPGTYIFARTYAGIDDSFPHFDAIHGLPDDQIISTLLALARGWLTENRAKVLARLRRERVAYQSRQFTTKPGPQPSTATRSHDRARYWRTLCGPRTDAGRVSRIFRLAGWGNFDPDALGRATGSRRFWLARVADRQTAQTIVEAVTDRLGRLPLSDAVGNYWTIWNCRLGIVDAARLTAKDRAVAGAEIRRMEAGENAGDAEAIRLHLLPAVRELVGDALKELPREPYPSAGRETDDAGDGIRDTTIAAGGTPTPRDLIPLTWLREQVPQRYVKGDASKLALWLGRKGRNVQIHPVARKNYAERSELLRVFNPRSKVHKLIAEYTADGD